MKSAVSAVLLSLASATNVPTVEIEAGVFMPMQGLGTWQYNDSVAEAAVDSALRMGYTHIDTAYGYGNQVGVGRGLASSGRARSSYFLTTKIPGGMKYDDAMALLKENLEQLGLEYVDLVLTHFPATWGGEGGKALRQEEWRALEAFKEAGGTRSIGVSHYCRSHLDDILAINTTAIAVNQVEYHIGMGSAGVNATDDKDYCQSLGITYQAFSTLCGPCGTDELINGALVTGIGNKYNKSGAQVSLKWATQQGVPVLPKASNVAFQEENLDLFSWDLSEQDMATLTLSAKPPACGGGEDYPGESGDCPVA